MNELTPQETFQAVLDGKKVEYRHPHLDWTILKPNSFKLSKLLAPDYQFRLAQERVTVGDVSFPKPESEPPELGTEYWIADPSYRHYETPNTLTWVDDSTDHMFLKRGLIHLSRGSAVAHAKALIKLSGGTYGCI